MLLPLKKRARAIEAGGVCPVLRRKGNFVVLLSAIMITGFTGISCNDDDVISQPIDTVGTIIFMKYSPSGKQKMNKQIWALRPSTGEAWEIQAHVGSDIRDGVTVDISHDCRQVSYITANYGSSEEERSHVIVENLDGSNRVKFFPPGNSDTTDHLWSPDDTQIAFMQSGSVYITDKVGNIVKNFSIPGLPQQSSWSPDGKKFAFVLYGKSGSESIYVIDADGSNLIDVTAEQAESGPVEPRWSPDSKKLVYIVMRGINVLHEIWVVDLTNLERHKIWAPQTDWPWPSVDGATWSPDGKYIAFSTSSDEPRQRFGKHASDIWIMGSDGSDPHPLVEGPDNDEIQGWRSCSEAPHSMGSDSAL